VSEAGRKMLAATEALIAELIALRAENERLRVEVAQLKSILESTSITRRGTIVS
jgi:regulator of replication initiation timing